ncbi:beta-lactamase-like protein [Hyaloraphidium curvatum]|nr:beta-lactamase-like protein [Hyaloraphidium curvatum]
MRVTFLGTSSGTPTRHRNVSSIAVHDLERSSDVLLFDCGEGTQHRFLAPECPANTSKLSHVFISHLHGDHCFGLPGLLASMSMAGGRPGGGEAPAAEDGVPEPGRTVRIFGPVGLKFMLRTALGLSETGLGFNLGISELVPRDTTSEAVEQYRASLPPPLPYETGAQADWMVFFDEERGCYPAFCRVAGSYVVSAAPLAHRIASFGFLIAEDPLPGKLDAAKCDALGVPRGKLLSELKSGRDVVLPDGREVRAAEVLGPSQPGRRIVILGDTCDSSQMAGLAADCDLMTHEATLEDGMEALAVERGHSTPSMAAKFAASVGCQRLVLTHFSARYLPPSKAGDGQPSTAILLDQAREAADREGARAMVVTAAEDFASIKVPRRHPT